MPKRKRKTTGWCCCHFGNYSSFVNWIIHFSIHQPLFVCFSSTNIIFRNEVDKGQIRQQWWVSSHDNVAAASTCWKLDNRKRNSDFQSFPPCTSLLCSPSLSQLLFYLHFLAYRTQNVCLSRPILAILLRTYALCTFTCLNNAVVYQNWQISVMAFPKHKFGILSRRKPRRVQLQLCFTLTARTCKTYSAGILLRCDILAKVINELL